MDKNKQLLGTINSMDDLLLECYMKLYSNSSQVDEEIYKIFSDNILDLF